MRAPIGLEMIGMAILAAGLESRPGAGSGAATVTGGAGPTEQAPETGDAVATKPVTAIVSNVTTARAHGVSLGTAGEPWATSGAVDTPAGATNLARIDGTRADGAATGETMTGAAATTAGTRATGNAAAIRATRATGGARPIGPNVTIAVGVTRLETIAPEGTNAGTKDVAATRGATNGMARRMGAPRATSGERMADATAIPGEKGAAAARAAVSRGETMTGEAATRAAMTTGEPAAGEATTDRAPGISVMTGCAGRESSNRKSPRASPGTS